MICNLIHLPQFTYSSKYSLCIGIKVFYFAVLKLFYCSSSYYGMLNMGFPSIIEANSVSFYCCVHFNLTLDTRSTDGCHLHLLPVHITIQLNHKTNMPRGCSVKGLTLENYRYDVAWWHDKICRIRRHALDCSLVMSWLEWLYPCPTLYAHSVGYLKPMLVEDYYWSVLLQMSD